MKLSSHGQNDNAISPISSSNSDLTCGGAFRDCLTFLDPRNRAEKTVDFYRVQFRQLIRWADEEGVAYGMTMRTYAD